MSPEKQNIESLYTAVKEVAPDRADEIVQKYNLIRDNLSDSLVNKDLEQSVVNPNAEQAIAQLDKLAKSIIDEEGGKSPEKVANRLELLNAFDDELNAIADSIGLETVHLDLVEHNFERPNNEFTDLDKLYKDSFMEALTLLKAECRDFLNAGALEKYLFGSQIVVNGGKKYVSPENEIGLLVKYLPYGAKGVPKSLKKGDKVECKFWAITDRIAKVSEGRPELMRKLIEEEVEKFVHFVFTSKNPDGSYVFFDKSSPGVTTALLRKWPSLSKSEFKTSSTLEQLEAQNNFKEIDKFFASLGLYFEHADQYIEAFMQLDQDKRPSIDHLVFRLKSLRSQANADYLVAELHASDYELKAAVGLYCNGYVADAEQALYAIQEKIDSRKVVEKFHEKLGMKDLPIFATVKILDAFNSAGIATEEAIKLVEKVRELSPTEYASLSTLPVEKFASFVVFASLKYREGKKLDKDYVKAVLHIEAVCASKRNDLELKIDRNEDKLGKYFAELQDYRESHPDVMMDEGLSIIERNIATVKANLEKERRDLLLVNAKYDASVAYLQKDGVNPGTAKAKIDKFLSIKSIASLRELNREEKIEDSPFILMAESMDVKGDIATMDYEVADWRRNNPQVRAIYNGFMKSGHLTPGREAVLMEELTYNLQQIAVVNNRLVEVVDREYGFFEELGKKYGSISDVPESDRSRVALRLQGLMHVLNEYYGLQGRLLGINTTLDLMKVDKSEWGIVASSYQKVDGQLVQVLTFPGTEMETGKEPKSLEKPEMQGWFDQDSIRAEADGTSASMTKVAKFLGEENFKARDLDMVSASPIHVALLQKETAPFIEGFKQPFENVLAETQSINNIGKLFQNFQDNPEAFKRMGWTLHTVFKEGLKRFDTFISAVESARSHLESVRGDLVRALLDDSIYKTHPQLKPLREKLFTNAIAQLDELLTNEQSPMSRTTYLKVIQARSDLKEQYDEYVEKEFWQIVAVVAIVAVAVGVGLATAGAGTALGGALFGTVTEAGVYTAGMFAVGATTAKVGTGLLAMGGMALGATYGERFGMEMTDAFGLTEFGKQGLIRYDSASIWKDFKFNFLLSLGAVSLAKLTVMSVRFGQTLDPFKWTRLNMASHSAADHLAVLNRIASPHLWFARGSGVSLPKSLAGNFSLRWGRETAQEELETFVGMASGNPIVEFFVAVAASMDGINVDLNTKALGAEAVGIVIENGRYAYTAGDPEVFIAKLNETFGPGKFTAIINDDNSITLTFEQNGKTASIDVAPALKASPDVEVAHIEGVKVVDGQMYHTHPEARAQIIANLKAKGFVVKVEADGTIRTVKGFELTIKNGALDMEAELTTEQVQASPAYKWFMSMVEKIESPEIRAKLGSFIFNMSKINAALCASIVTLLNPSTVLAVTNEGGSETMAMLEALKSVPGWLVGAVDLALFLYIINVGFGKVGKPLLDWTGQAAKLFANSRYASRKSGAVQSFQVTAQKLGSTQANLLGGLDLTLPALDAAKSQEIREFINGALLTYITSLDAGRTTKLNQVQGLNPVHAKQIEKLNKASEAFISSVQNFANAVNTNSNVEVAYESVLEAHRGIMTEWDKAPNELKQELFNKQWKVGTFLAPIVVLYTLWRILEYLENGNKSAADKPQGPPVNTLRPSGAGGVQPGGVQIEPIPPAPGVQPPAPGVQPPAPGVQPPAPVAPQGPVPVTPLPGYGGVVVPPAGAQPNGAAGTPAPKASQEVIKANEGIEQEY